MAIQKSKTLPSGVSGNYWKLFSAHLSKPKGVIHVTCILRLFVDEAHSIASPDEPIEGIAIATSFDTTVQEITGNMIALCYAKTKEANHPDLADGVDV